jgi:translation initiation factor 2B subunit (eIF-2B alpha/beta/delta family)
LIATITSSAGTVETFVIGSASPLEDSSRVIVNESTPHNRDGIDERSFR